MHRESLTVPFKFLKHPNFESLMEKPLKLNRELKPSTLSFSTEFFKWDFYDTMSN
jgi:hypothetical protein